MSPNRGGQHGFFLLQNSSTRAFPLPGSRYCTVRTVHRRVPHSRRPCASESLALWHRKPKMADDRTLARTGERRKSCDCSISQCASTRKAGCTGHTWRYARAKPVRLLPPPACYHSHPSLKAPLQHARGTLTRPCSPAAYHRSQPHRHSPDPARTFLLHLLTFGAAFLPNDNAPHPAPSTHPRRIIKRTALQSLRPNHKCTCAVITPGCCCKYTPSPPTPYTRLVDRYTYTHPSQARPQPPHKRSTARPPWFLSERTSPPPENHHHHYHQEHGLCATELAQPLLLLPLPLLLRLPAFPNKQQAAASTAAASLLQRR